MSAMQGHPNKIFEQAANAAESARQTGVASAIAAGGSSATIQKNVAAAEATFLRAVIAAAAVANVEAGVYRQALYAHVSAA